MGFFFLFLRTECDFCCLAGLFYGSVQSPSTLPSPSPNKAGSPFCAARLPSDKYLYFMRL